MCGFFGHFSNKFTENIQELNNRYQLAINSLYHRGPDDSGLETFKIKSEEDKFTKLLSLGHTRLSIIELSKKGHQPMSSSDGRYVIVYNGEIYNYKELRNELKDLGHTFKTQSDTEVLIAAWSQWGPESLKKIIGMFAFAIFDQINQTLTLARDAFGIKPLFYRNDENSIYFASELPALIKLIPEKLNINLQRSYDYLVHNNYDSNSDTFFQEIKHLLPAHFITFDLKNVSKSKPVCWWKPNITTNLNLSFEEAAQKLRSLFLDSVKLHLRSDVPIGVALSGGIDSSAIASVVRYLEPNIPLNTFSYIASDNNISEEKWIDLINTKLNSKPHKITIESKEIEKDLDNLISKQGEPFGGTSIYAQYRLFKSIKKTGIKVILDGQGADEILGGYLGYPGHRLLSLVETKGWFAAHRFAKNWSRVTRKSYLLAWMYFARLKLPDFFYQKFHKFLHEVIKNKLGKNFSPSWLNFKYLNSYNIEYKEIRVSLKKENKGQRVKEALAIALTNQGLPSLLRHADRNSMAFSIESRVPFLTLPLVDFLFSLPEQYLISDEGITKHIFRQAMRGIVPDEILNRKDKIGFATPEDAWLVNKSDSIIKYIKQSEQIPFINKEKLLKEFQEIINGKKILNSRVWRLFNYFYWYSLVSHKLAKF
jgi:asparagine synthase (glutamine-hydrolysing)